VGELEGFSEDFGMAGGFRGRWRVAVEAARRRSDDGEGGERQRQGPSFRFLVLRG
jgi:hypothetical protein